MSYMDRKDHCRKKDEKFHDRSKEARKDFKQVKDKFLGKGLVILVKNIEEINKKLSRIIKKDHRRKKCH